MKNTLQNQLHKIEFTYKKINFEDSHVYAQWLAQSYFFVRHSTRLLNLSSGLTPFELNFYHLRANEHAHEEKNHEKMLIMDLKDLGYKIEDFNESPIIKAFYQTQYYTIEHIHPLGFIGYIYLLESLPLGLGKTMLKKIEPSYGKKATTFLRVHTQEDEKHIESLLKLIESLPKDLSNQIEQNLILSGTLYNAFFQELAEISLKKTNAA